jgi:hypothetical protein
MFFHRCVWGALLLCAIAAAAVVPRYSLEELVSQSEKIVAGRVQRVSTAWDPEHKFIWTHYDVLVSDSLRGSRDRIVTVSEPGGSLDGIHQMVGGALPYSIGEEVVLFLYRTPIGYFRTTGGGQGKFTVSANGRVHANTGGIEIIGPARGTSLGTLENLDLRQFLSTVRAAAPRVVR